MSGASAPSNASTLAGAPPGALPTSTVVRLAHHALSSRRRAAPFRSRVRQPVAGSRWARCAHPAPGSHARTGFKTDHEVRGGHRLQVAVKSGFVAAVGEWWPPPASAVDLLRRASAFKPTRSRREAPFQSGREVQVFGPVAVRIGLPRRRRFETVAGGRKCFQNDIGRATVCRCREGGFVSSPARASFGVTV